MRRICQLLASAAATAAASAVALIGVASPASAQIIYPTTVQGAEILLGVPCTGTSTTLDCAGHNQNNIYVSLHHDDATGTTNSYVFDPYTGRSTHVNVYVENGNITIHYIDSERGVIIVSPHGWGDLANPDGWLSPFYPSGNPFSAAIHSATEGLGLPWNSDPGDGDGGWGGGGGDHDPILP